MYTEHWKLAALLNHLWLEMVEDSLFMTNIASITLQFIFSYAKVQCIKSMISLKGTLKPEGRICTNIKY